MNTTIIFQAIVVIVLFTSQALAATDSLVTPVCRYISQHDPINVNYEYCTMTLGFDPRSMISTAPQLGQIAYELSISRAKDIIATIDRLQHLSASDPLSANALKDCLAVYSSVPKGLAEGLEALQGGDFATASSRVSAAMNAATTCGNRIGDRRGNISPLTKASNDFYQLSAIILGFTNLMRIIN